MNIGNYKEIDKIKICRSFETISVKLFVDKNPPEDMAVRAKLNESRSLILNRVYKKIIKIVEIK